MPKYTLFFSDKCPDTASFVKKLQQQGVVYEEINVTESMSNLKKFLQLRDTRVEFEKIKICGFVGVPVLLLENGDLIFEPNDLSNINF